MMEHEWGTTDDSCAMLSFICNDGLGSGQGDNKIALSDRKIRLLACACCRIVWNSLEDSRVTHCVEAGERHADGDISEHEMHKTWRKAFIPEPPDRLDRRLAYQCAGHTTVLKSNNNGLSRWFSISTEYRHQQADIIRDIAGNPFRDPFPGAIKVGDLMRMEVASTSRLRKCLLGENADAVVIDVSQGGDKVSAMLVHSNYTGTWDTPSTTRCPWVTPQVTLLAKSAYENRLDETGILNQLTLFAVADALEEAGAEGEMLSHLRSNKPHYRGCWVLDTLLGKS